MPPSPSSGRSDARGNELPKVRSDRRPRPRPVEPNEVRPTRSESRSRRPSSAVSSSVDVFAEGGCGRALRQDPERLSGHGVQVQAAEEAPVDEHFEVGRVAAGEAPLIQVDGPHVLPAPEQQLRLLPALDDGAPRRHRHGHQDAHDPDRDQQPGHGVAGLGAQVSRAAARAHVDRLAQVYPAINIKYCKQAAYADQDHPTRRHRRAQAESWRVLGFRTGGIVGLTQRRPVGKTAATPRIGGRPSRAVRWDVPVRRQK